MARSSLGRNRRGERDTHTPSQRILAPKRGAQPLFAAPASPSPLFFFPSSSPFFHLCHPKSSSSRLAELRKWRLRAQFEKQAGRPSFVCHAMQRRYALRNACMEGEGCSSPLPMIPPDSFAPRKTLLSVPTVKLASGGAQLISAPAGILIKRNNLRNMGQGEERVWRGGKEERRGGNTNQDTIYSVVGVMKCAT